MNINTILCRTFVIAFSMICKEILKSLEISLSEAELDYVHDLGPQIASKWNLRDALEIPSASSSHSRAAGREAERLEKEAKDKLTKAGVSDQRQMFLWKLVANTQYDWDLMGKLEASNIDLKIETDYRSGFLSICAETCRLKPDLHKFSSILDSFIKYAQEEAA